MATDDASAALLRWQAEFIRRMLSPGPVVPFAINGGIGVGKSRLLGCALGIVATTRPGSTSGLLSDSWPSLRENNLPYLRTYFGKHARWFASDKLFEFRNGSRVELRHYDLPEGHDESRNPIEGRTYAGGLLVLDEAQKVAPVAYKHMVGRSRGLVTDLNGREWPTRIILCGRPNAGTWWWEQEAKDAGGEVFKPMTKENPHNGPDYLNNLRTAYTDAMFRCITEGAPAPTTGGVFGEWSAETYPFGNVIDGWQYNPGAPVSLGIDFGRRTPAVVWFQSTIIGDRTVDVMFDEVAPDGVLTPELVAHVKREWAARWPGVGSLYGQAPCRWRTDIAYADPAGNAKNPQTGATDVSILRRQSDPGDGLGDGLGCMVVTTTDAAKVSVSAGLMKVCGAVKAADGSRTLVMTRELYGRGMAAPVKVRTLARSLMQYTWAHAEKKASGGTEHPSTHHVDAVRYRQIGARWSGDALAFASGASSIRPVSTVR